MTFDESELLGMRFVGLLCSFDFCIRDNLVYVHIHRKTPSLPVCRFRLRVQALSSRGDQNVAQLQLEDPHYIIQSPRYLTIIAR